MRSFTFPIQWRACLFALLNLSSRLLYSLRYVVGCACAVDAICVCFPSITYASSPSANDVHFCQILDYEDIRARDSLYAATKQALNLDVGEPRTVRMIYFLPNDRPFQQAVVDSMKVTIRQIQTFYADQMEAHGYGRKTFRFETDAQGNPVVHRVDGQHPDSYYLENRGYWQESGQKFDTRANNVYWMVLDNSISLVKPGVAGSAQGGSYGGSAIVSETFSWTLVAHELGHTFGLGHDFRDGDYIMSYGPPGLRYQLSACHAEYLSVHPYFDPDISDKGTPPTIELISPPGYPTGSTSVSIQLRVSDPDGLHQVILFVSGLKACRSLNGEINAVVQFDYDGVPPPAHDPYRTVRSLSDFPLHSFYVQAVDTEGNVGDESFKLWDVAYRRNAIATLEEDDGVLSLAFSSDGTLLASGSADSEVNLWDVATRIKIATLETETEDYRPNRVYSVAFSPDGTLLASGSIDSKVNLWDVTTRTKIATLEGHADRVSSVAFSPDGTMLASGGGHRLNNRDFRILLWDVTTRTKIATLEGHADGVNNVAFSSDGEILASGSEDGTVKLWDVATRTKIATFEGHADRVRSVAFSPDGTMLASGDSFGKVKLWDVVTRRNIATFEHGRFVSSVAFSPDGTILASGSVDGYVKLWDVAVKHNLAMFGGHTNGVNSVVFSPDGTILASASGSEDGTILLWDTSKWMRPRPAALLKVSGDNQQGTSGAALTSPLVVELRDQYGSALPLQGVPVTFTVTEGNGKLGGRFTVENTVTDANGRAQTALTLGPNPGTNTVEISFAGSDPLTFNAVGVGTNTIPIIGDNYQKRHLPDGAIVRLGKGKIGSSDRAIAFSPDGQYLAVASRIGIWLYDVATYRELALIPGHITFVAFSPDGTLLALGRYGGSAELWDVSTRTKIATLRNWDVNSVAFSPDGTLLTLGRYRAIELWDVSTRTNIATLKGHTDIVNSVTFSPDGTLLASGSNDGTVKLWDVATRTNIATLKGHTDIVNSVTFSPDGTLLASGSNDGTVLLWDVATRRNVATLERQDVLWVHSVVFSPDGTLLALGSWPGGVKLWDIATKRNIATLERHVTRVYSVAFSPDGTILASGAWGRVELWDVAKKNITLERHSQVESVVFSPDGTTLASGAFDNTVKLWDVATWTNITTLKGHTSKVNSVVFSPDGTTLASGSFDNTVKLWDVATRTNIATLKGHTNGVNSVVFSPDGTTLASGSFDNTVKLWDVATRTNIATLKGHTNGVNSVVFSPDGTTLASGSFDNTVKLWDVATWTNITTLKGHTNRVNSVVFSPDGTTLASGSEDGTVKLWDIATGTNIATLEGYPLDLSFSPDGTILASGTSHLNKDVNKDVILWDVATLKNIATLEGHTNRVNSVSFSPDGTTLASGSEDGTVLLWDMSPYITPQTPTSAPTPDFNGDGTVGISDFLQFVELFGFSQGDAGFDARFDLDGDGVIGVGDFLIFVDNFGKKVS